MYSNQAMPNSRVIFDGFFMKILKNKFEEFMFNKI